MVFCPKEKSGPLFFKTFIILKFYLFWGEGGHTMQHDLGDYGILVPKPQIEPTPPAVEAWSLNHWTTKEVLKGRTFIYEKIKVQITFYTT